MEDSVTEAESIVYPKQQEEDDDKNKDYDQEEHNNGGLLNRIVSSLVSKVEANDDDDDDKENQEKQKEEKAEEDMKGGGGILDSLISHLASPSSTKAESGIHLLSRSEGEVSEVHKDKENEEVETEEEGGGGIIDNIVSHFPSALADDAVPTTDEASILIHSIVHD